MAEPPRLYWQLWSLLARLLGGWLAQLAGGHPDARLILASSRRLGLSGLFDQVQISGDPARFGYVVQGGLDGFQTLRRHAQGGGEDGGLHGDLGLGLDPPQ